MTLAFIGGAAGLILLIWSAGVFIEGSAAVARHYGMSPLLIGMLVVGFGTSAPELLVSAIAALDNNPGIALGNVYGSNISNIALILGLTAVIGPIAVQSTVVRRELPVLIAVTAVAAAQLWDGEVSRLDALLLLAIFGGLVVLSLWQDRHNGRDPLGMEFSKQLAAHPLGLPRAVLYLVAGLLLLVASSRLLVWSAVTIASGFGVSDLIIGLTIVAVGTSLPELASSVVAAAKGEHDIALGNIIGSNLFNTLMVVGVAGVIRPLQAPPELLIRDVALVGGLTVLLYWMSFGLRKTGTIGRLEGATLLTVYISYVVYLISIAAGS